MFNANGSFPERDTLSLEVDAEFVRPNDNEFVYFGIYDSLQTANLGIRGNLFLTREDATRLRNYLNDALKDGSL